MKRGMLTVLMVMLICSTFVFADSTSKIRREFYVGDSPVSGDASGTPSEVSDYDFFNSSDLAWIVGAVIFVIVLGSWILYGKKKRRSRNKKKTKRKSKK